MEMIGEPNVVTTVRYKNSDGNLPSLVFERLEAQGHLPFSSWDEFSYPVDLSVLFDGWRLLASTRRTRFGLIAVVAERDGVLAFATSAVLTRVQLAASSPEIAECVGRELSDKCVTFAPVVSEQTVVSRMWTASPSRATHTMKSFIAPAWVSIQSNYSEMTSQALAQQIRMRPPTLSTARLIVWHGETGTGKTTAVRSLLREWSPWCSADYVVDPERFFADPAYITEVIASTRPTGWRVVVAEDCDDYLTARPNGTSHGALARLLSLGDGLLGQGSNTLLLLTTNIDPRVLHPAVVRPGRCLSMVEFSRLSSCEATRVSGRQIHQPTTLAESIALRDDGLRPVDVPAFASTYL